MMIANNIPSPILIMASVRWYNASAHYALFLADELKNAGIKIILFGIPESPIVNKAKELGIEVIDDINLMDSNPISYVRNIAKFRRAVHDRKIEIINPHISRDHTFACLSLSGNNMPLVRTRTDSIPPKNNMLNRFFYSHSVSHFIVSSNNMLSYIKDMGLVNSRLSVVPLEMNYIEFADFKPCENLKKKLGIPDDKIIASFAGRLDAVKGVEHFLRSHTSLKNREKFHFIISGEDINLSAEHLKGIANELGIKNISIIGKSNEVREILSITDIGVIPSVGSEAICRIALEMLSFGIPIIGSNINSIPEVISEYDGIIVNPGIPEEIAEALERLLDNDNFKRIKKNIKRKISQRTPNRFITEYLDIFSKVI